MKNEVNNNVRTHLCRGISSKRVRIQRGRATLLKETSFHVNI